MSSVNIDNLNRKFSLHRDGEYLYFEMGEGGLAFVYVQNTQSRAKICLQGAHLLSWIPVGKKDVIWLSSLARFEPGKPIRGGIPVCWPWFGAHQEHTSYPAHGFARTSSWQVKDARSISATETKISFSLDTHHIESQLQAMWPWPTVLEYSITISDTLKLELKTMNNSDQSITIGQALHTYFDVGDIANTSVFGLQNKKYLDKTDGFCCKQQTGPVRIDAEVDRVYLEASEDIEIDNTKRKIIISKQASQSTVVWNPGKEVAKKMGDIGENGYLSMLCVESANVADDVVKIPAGESHQLVVTYKVG